MDITPYIDSLRRDLVAAAEAAGPDTRQAAERLTFALDPAARLALMEAVSQAAATSDTAERRGGRGGGRHRPDHPAAAGVREGQGRGVRRPLGALPQHL